MTVYEVVDEFHILLRQMFRRVSRMSEDVPHSVVHWPLVGELLIDAAVLVPSDVRFVLEIGGIANVFLADFRFLIIFLLFVFFGILRVGCQMLHSLVVGQVGHGTRGCNSGRWRRFVVIEWSRAICRGICRSLLALVFLLGVISFIQMNLKILCFRGVGKI
jgi:hypothetical protein